MEFDDGGWEVDTTARRGKRGSVQGYGTTD